MLSLRGTTACRAPAVPRRSPAPRRLAAPVRAGGLGEALNTIGQAFVKIFSPPKDDAPNGNWEGTASSFSGRISHHGPGRPFKDGFAAAAGGAADAAHAASAPATDLPASESADYLGGALKSVMDKNFSGKDDDNKPTTGAEGWKGDLHGRNRDGFHLPRK
ncbi:hypothetical protein Rsub_02610 [Raphidocelis subcapitata]|uniref:Uncharacterized protein n=1 Tax=Raphidocelis subcapitata TaxID=307507 RepID=A0A2V0NQI8_9CHLO|nr:hypothetical protein Rsub_02610 [Raphidocelis subcapitata]|eukprot:GBF89906.1 hypothetical protein Rsub_02610 [Raphidocelis subcapitata]